MSTADNIIAGLTFFNKIQEPTESAGKAKMIECFAHWCPPCVRALPHVA